MTAKPRSTRAAWAAAAVAMTLVAVLLYANLTSPDQPIEHAIAHRYAPRDPQFLRDYDPSPRSASGAGQPSDRTAER